MARAVKDLGKLKEERDAREQEVKLAAEREITHLREAAADLLRICGSDDEARRYFTVVGRDGDRGERVQPEPAALRGHLRAGKMPLLSDAAARLEVGDRSCRQRCTDTH